MRGTRPGGSSLPQSSLSRIYSSRHYSNKPAFQSEPSVVVVACFVSARRSTRRQLGSWDEHSWWPRPGAPPSPWQAVTSKPSHSTFPALTHSNSPSFRPPSPDGRRPRWRGPRQQCWSNLYLFHNTLWLWCKVLQAAVWCMVQPWDGPSASPPTTSTAGWTRAMRATSTASPSWSTNMTLMYFVCRR